MSITVGILGFAHGHVSTYCDAWSKDEGYGIRVAAGWDHDRDRLNHAVESFGITPYADIEELLTQADVQAVIIGAETALHADLVECAARAHKAIVLQKPISLTLQEADRIVSAVEAFGVPFTMAWQMRVDPQNVQMKALLDSGEMGKVFMVRRRHGLGVGLTPSFADSWHVQPDLNRDIWSDDASHPIDFIHWLLGVPESVTAEIESLYNPRIPMDNGVAIFRYPEGQLAEVSCSFTCSAAESTTEIICERGTILQNYGDVPSCNIERPNDLPGLKWYSNQTNEWTNSEIPSPDQHGVRIRSLAKPLAEFLHGQRPPIATAQDGRTSLVMLLATYVSDREGRRVSLSDDAIQYVE